MTHHAPNSPTTSAASSSTISSTTTTSPQPPATPPWLVQWDSSFSPAGAGIGITISRPNCLPTVEASIPVYATDATRAEALGPPTAALLLGSLPSAEVHFIGDSQYIVNVIDRLTLPEDLHIYHCAELCRDLLSDRLIRATWVPRDLNERCDSLAKQARDTSHLAVQCAPEVFHL